MATTIATKLSYIPYGSILHLANNINNTFSNRLIKLVFRVINAVFLPATANISARYNLVAGGIFLVTLILSFPFVSSSTSLSLFSHSICHFGYLAFDAVLGETTSSSVGYLASLIFLIFIPNALSKTTNFLNLAQKAVGNLAIK